MRQTCGVPGGLAALGQPGFGPPEPVREDRHGVGRSIRRTLLPEGLSLQASGLAGEGARPLFGTTTCLTGGFRSTLGRRGSRTGRFTGHRTDCLGSGAMGRRRPAPPGEGLEARCHTLLAEPAGPKGGTVVAVHGGTEQRGGNPTQNGGRGGELGASQDRAGPSHQAVEGLALALGDFAEAGSALELSLLEAFDSLQEVGEFGPGLGSEPIHRPERRARLL